MNKTIFTQKIWGLTKFNEVGYDAENKTFTIFYFDNTILEFFDVDEEVVFQLIISPDKNHFIEDVLITNYNYNVHATNNHYSASP